MDNDQLVAIMAELDFPENQYVIFGGACLAAYNIRPTTDLEIFVTPALYDKLRTTDWEERITGSTGANYLTKVVSGIMVLAFISCGSEKWRPNVGSYLKQPEIIGGLRFMPLSEMYAWKAATARPKDIVDCNLIDKYWSSIKI